MSGQSDSGQQANVQTQGQTPAQPQPQPGAHPQQESLGRLLTKPRTKEYLKFFTGMYAIVGLAVGLSLVAVGILGGAVLQPDLSGTVSNVLEDNVENLDAILSQMHMNRLASQAINGAPLLAALLGVLTGTYVGTTLDVEDREAYVNAAASSAVGSFVLVTLVGFLASTQIEPVPSPELSSQAQQLSTEAQMTTSAGMGAVEGIPSAILVGGTKLAVSNLLLNAALVGVVVAVVSAGAVYVVRNFAPEA
ncbi:hypothetical protein DMJ13_01765 [halophilic archaeon]|nr:hypothetical protein DMJ13_01765 [halophilic archaeon]